MKKSTKAENLLKSIGKRIKVAENTSGGEEKDSYRDRMTEDLWKELSWTFKVWKGTPFHAYYNKKLNLLGHQTRDEKTTGISNDLGKSFKQNMLQPIMISVPSLNTTNLTGDGHRISAAPVRDGRRISASLVREGYTNFCGATEQEMAVEFPQHQSEMVAEFL